MNPSLSLLIGIGEAVLEQVVSMLENGWGGQTLARTLVQEPNTWDKLWVIMRRVEEFAALGKNKVLAVLIGTHTGRTYTALRELRNQRLIAIVQKHGVICVKLFSRDCDCAESTTYHSFASAQDFLEFEYRAYENAEGLTYFEFVSWDEYRRKPDAGSRDRALEAYENGNHMRAVI